MGLRDLLIGDGRAASPFDGPRPGIARGARLSVQRITEDANRADAVCRMYRGRNAAVVDREHRAELQRLHDELHSARAALRVRLGDFEGARADAPSATIARTSASDVADLLHVHGARDA